jgi:hypothetical protein
MLSNANWQELHAAFSNNYDPPAGKYPCDPAFDQLFTRIVMQVPAPIGWG